MPQSETMRVTVQPCHRAGGGMQPHDMQGEIFLYGWLIAEDSIWGGLQ